MTTPDAHCDMCNQKFQPQRANKTGPRYCGNACRQRAHRRRSREAKLQGPPFGVTGVTLPPRAASDDPSVWVRLVDMLDMGSEAAQTKRPGNRLQMVEAYVAHVVWQRNHFAESLRNETERADKWQEIKLNLRSNALSLEEWIKLRGFTDAELRNWVKAGGAMEQKGHDSPMSNALRWVEQNSPQLGGSLLTFHNLV